MMMKKCFYTNTVCFFISQVYKVRNSNIDDEKKVIFIAESGLNELIKNEELLLGIAKGYDCASIEKTFENMIESAIDDYHIFNANVLKNPTGITAEVLINFSDFFEYVIDVKKNEIENAALNAVTAIVDSVQQTTSIPMATLSAPISGQQMNSNVESVQQTAPIPIPNTSAPNIESVQQTTLPQPIQHVAVAAVAGGSTSNQGIDPQQQQRRAPQPVAKKNQRKM